MWPAARMLQLARGGLLAGLPLGCLLGGARRGVAAQLTSAARRPLWTGTLSSFPRRPQAGTQEGQPLLWCDAVQGCAGVRVQRQIPTAGCVPAWSGHALPPWVHARLVSAALPAAQPWCLQVPQHFSAPPCPCRHLVQLAGLPSGVAGQHGSRPHGSVARLHGLLGRSAALACPATEVTPVFGGALRAALLSPSSMLGGPTLAVLMLGSPLPSLCRQVYRRLPAQLCLCVHVSLTPRRGRHLLGCT